MKNTLLPLTGLGVMSVEAVVPNMEAWDDPTRPSVMYYPQFRIWRLAKTFSYTHQGWTLRVPAPFDFDLASIPRVLWPWLGSHELGILAPLFHDWLYRSAGGPTWGSVTPGRTFTRAEADYLFLHHMEREDVPRVKRQAAYRAVRWFGGGSWRKT